MSRERRFLLLLLLASTLARCLAFSGWQASDDLGYYHYALEMAHGRYAPAEDVVSLRIGYLLPIAALQALGGLGYRIVTLYNLACGLGTIVLAWMLARRWAGDTAGRWAAAVAALVPTTFAGATELHSDVPAAFWMGCSVLLLARGGPVAGLLAGLAGGWACLTKESSLFIVPVWLLLGWRGRRVPTLLALAGFGLVLAAEAGWHAASTGDPLYHLHVVSHGRHEGSVRAIYPDAAAIARRILWGFPAMALDIRTPAWLALGPLYLAGAAALWLLWRHRREEALPAAGWLACFWAILNFWPLSWHPYLPSFILGPRPVEPLALPCAVLVGLGLQVAGPVMARRAGGALLALMAAGCAEAWYTAQTQAHTLRTTFAIVQARPEGRIYGDPRTLDSHRVFDGERGSRDWLPLDEETPSATGPALVVLDQRWMRNLSDWYGYRPPAWTQGPPPPRWELLAEIPPTPFPWRGAGAGARVYRIPP